ncbi:MAG: radical SAM protein [Alphaproteobacteria bacterium]|nr:radical SAM protein [Alphaproteobacteria bacterium]
MSLQENARVVLKDKDNFFDASAVRLTFCPEWCFREDDSPEEVALLQTLGREVGKWGAFALYGTGRLTKYMLKHVPGFAESVAVIITDDYDDPAVLPHVDRVAPDAIPDSVKMVFLCTKRTFPRMQMRYRIPGSKRIIDPTVLETLLGDKLPRRAWIPKPTSIYPIKLQDMDIRPNLDVLLVDCPSRNLSLMPNGLGFVYNAIKATGCDLQLFDFDNYCYHFFHIERLFEWGGTILQPDGTPLPKDPWQVHEFSMWQEQPINDYLQPLIELLAAKIVAASPKILGLSVSGANEVASRRMVNLIKAANPEITVIVGGFSCYQPSIGMRAFPECDYMCIGEADLTAGKLVSKLLAGESAVGLPGVMSRFDAPDQRFVPAPMAHNLDRLEPPRYEWTDLSNYRTFAGTQVAPVIASRGCRWSRCTFCAERFYWRIHSAKAFVDELEWLYDRGIWAFNFNESDLNGDPQRLVDIAEEVIARKLPFNFGGQLRINKGNDRNFFETLAKAGFSLLRFGVDAFADGPLREQKKGYSKDVIRQNLKDCHDQGIYTQVNWVIGVPGETMEDIDEGIDFILENREYIDSLENIHPLMLVVGSVYWLDPEAYGIKFRRPQEEIMDAHPRYVPPDLWYSTGPYIDNQVRKEYFTHIVRRLRAEDFPIGSWADKVISDVEEDREFFERTDLEEDARRLEKQFVKSFEGYDIFGYDGMYYAVPEGYGEVEAREIAKVLPPGLLRESDVTGLENSIRSTRAIAERFAALESSCTTVGPFDSVYLDPGKADEGDGRERGFLPDDGVTLLTVQGERFAVSDADLKEAYLKAAKTCVEQGRDPKRIRLQPSHAAMNPFTHLAVASIEDYALFTVNFMRYYAVKSSSFDREILHVDLERDREVLRANTPKELITLVRARLAAEKRRAVVAAE